MEGLSEERTQSPPACELCVEGEEVEQEVLVWVNGSFPAHMRQGITECETLAQHQVRQDQRRRATHAHNAMHQHLSYTAE